MAEFEKLFESDLASLVDAYRAYPEHADIDFAYDEIDYSGKYLPGLELDSVWSLASKKLE